MPDPMKIAIYGRNTNDNISQYIQSLFHKLNGYKAELYVYESFYKYIKHIKSGSGR